MNQKTIDNFEMFAEVNYLYNCSIYAALIIFKCNSKPHIVRKKSTYGQREISKFLYGIAIIINVKAFIFACSLNWSSITQKPTSPIRL